jgi:hypothetical protein
LGRELSRIIANVLDELDRWFSKSTAARRRARRR